MATLALKHLLNQIFNKNIRQLVSTWCARGDIYSRVKNIKGNIVLRKNMIVRTLVAKMSLFLKLIFKEASLNSKTKSEADLSRCAGGYCPRVLLRLDPVRIAQWWSADSRRKAEWGQLIVHRKTTKLIPCFHPCSKTYCSSCSLLVWRLIFWTSSSSALTIEGSMAAYRVPWNCSKWICKTGKTTLKQA